MPARCALTLIAATIPAIESVAGNLAFIEQSSGLETPFMEGGRTEFEFADINADGHLDLISIGDHGSPNINSPQAGIMVWFGNGAFGGTMWSHVQSGNFGYGGIALGDVNNDGIIDAAYGMHHNYSGVDLGNQVLEVALGNGTGVNWTPWDDGLGQQGQTWGMFSTDLADVDNDGWLDVGSISFGCCDGLHVHRNNHDGTWPPVFTLLGGNSSMEFYFGDFNGDGHADFAASHQSGTVRLGDGNGGFALADAGLPGSPPRSGLSIGDVNGDGRDDIAWASGTAIHVWTRSEAGQWQNLSANLATLGETFHRTQIADMDLDGKGEIIAARIAKVVVYGMNEQGQWDLLSQINLPAGCGSAAALRAGYDADHNGWPDLVVVTKENCGQFGLRGKNRPRFFANATAAVEPFIHPVFPRGGQTFRAGQVRFVRWHAAIPEGARGGTLPTVSIDFSTQGDAGPWTAIASNIPSNGELQWHLPASLPSTSQAHLRLTLHTDPPASSITPLPFHIIGGPAHPADITGDGIVNVADLLAAINAWGDCPTPPASCPADIAPPGGDGVVNVQDMLMIIQNWG